MRRPERLVCLDIETVPDRDLLPPGWGDKFPRTIHHQVACISLVEAEIEIDGDERERYHVTDCRSGGEIDWSERRQLEGWWSYFSRRPTRVVTWNGRGFDIPVLLHRSMVHGLTATGWHGCGSRYDGYTYRYSDDRHCDLMDLLSDYGACSKIGLDDMATALGLPGKVGGHGSEVAAMMAAGEIEKVRKYCEADCLNLMVIYMRAALLTGRSTRAGYEASADEFRLFCAEHSDVHIQTFGA